MDRPSIEAELGAFIPLARAERAAEARMGGEFVRWQVEAAMGNRITVWA
ncbi:MAG: hypothetical protein M3022_01930 [Actinomycetota bacterium]|nr:hypothetical protein [Actinomycetota bacterium]